MFPEVNQSRSCVLRGELAASRILTCTARAMALSGSTVTPKDLRIVSRI